MFYGSLEKNGYVLMQMEVIGEKGRKEKKYKESLKRKQLVVVLIKKKNTSNVNGKDKEEIDEMQQNQMRNLFLNANKMVVRKCVPLKNSGEKDTVLTGIKHKKDV